MTDSSPYLDRTAAGPYIWHFGEPPTTTRSVLAVEPGKFIRHVPGRDDDERFQSFTRSPDGAVWDGAGGSPIGMMVSP